jgi:NDP-sugar pyrophosphorylase family protein
MLAILLATGESEKLRPVTGSLPSPMLPIANRPVMAYTVEALARHGVKELLVSLYYLSGSIEGYFGAGRRWGVNIDYAPQRDGWGSAGSLRWAGRNLRQSFLALPADALIDFDVEAAMAYHRQHGQAVTVILHPADKGQPLYLDDQGNVTLAPVEGATRFDNTNAYIFEPEVLRHIPPRTHFDLRHDLLPALAAAGVPLRGWVMSGYWNPLDSFADYQEAQQVVLASAWDGGQLPEGAARLRYPGVAGRQIAPGIWVGRNPAIHPSALLSPPVLVGDNSRIGRNVELGPNTVVGADVIIDDEATINSSAILDHTYIGQLVEVQNRLVSKKQLVDAPTGQSAEVSDDFLLNETHPEMVDGTFRWGFEATLALLLALPITILLGLPVLLTSGRLFSRVERVYSRPRTLGGGGDGPQSVRLLHFYTRFPDGRPTAIGAWLEAWELNRLAELWNVVRGDLVLVGVKPLLPEEARQVTQSWQQARNSCPGGFTGLWYLETAPESDLDEVLVNDAYYVATQSRRQNLRLLWRAPGAWWRRNRRYAGRVQPRAITG